jgi:tRNA modification GTPase
MEKLASSFHDGRIIHEGLSVCLVGCPNVGKSSLMNALLDKDRAIVSHIPGTTRDVVEDHVRLNGFNFKLVDTAGLRHSSDTIEQEGIRRSKEAMAKADLVLLVLDASRELDQAEELELLKALPANQAIVVWNKMDLSNSPIPVIDFPHVVQLSAKNRLGLDLLGAKIDQVVWQHGIPSREEILITNVRHKEAIAQAANSCRQVIYGLRENVSPEFLALDMRQALAELGKIIGTNVSDDVLSSIFSQFCIGK